MLSDTPWENAGHYARKVCCAGITLGFSFWVWRSLYVVFPCGRKPRFQLFCHYFSAVFKGCISAEVDGVVVAPMAPTGSCLHSATGADTTSRWWAGSGRLPHSPAGLFAH